MTTNSISNFTFDGKGEAGDVKPLTHKRPMSSQEFWGKIANNSSVRVEHLPGQIVVYRGEKRIARWLPYPQVLHYIPSSSSGQCPDPPSTDTGVTTDDAGQVHITSPVCPTCGLNQMELYRKNADGSFFWGCPGKWGPRHCEGTIDVPARSMDELIALADYLVKTHSAQVAQGRRRCRSRIFDGALVGVAG
jgi:hypothetical protein